MITVNKWDYIGDGVYVVFDGYGFWLHANSHDNPTDRIYLEPQVALVLMRKVEEAYKKPEGESNAT